MPSFISVIGRSFINEQNEFIHQIVVYTDPEIKTLSLYNTGEFSDQEHILVNGLSQFVFNVHNNNRTFCIGLFGFIIGFFRKQSEIIETMSIQYTTLAEQHIPKRVYFKLTSNYWSLFVQFEPIQKMIIHNLTFRSHYVSDMDPEDFQKTNSEISLIRANEPAKRTSGLGIIHGGLNSVLYGALPPRCFSKLSEMIL